MKRSVLTFMVAAALTLLFFQAASDGLRDDLKSAAGDVLSGEEVSAAETTGVVDDLKASAGDALSGDEVSGAVSAMVEGGADAGALVGEALEAGYDPASVISGALSSGGDLDSITKAALSSGKVDDAGLADIFKDAGVDPETAATAIAGAADGLGEETHAGTGGAGSMPDGTVLPGSSIPPGGIGGGGPKVSPSG